MPMRSWPTRRSRTSAAIDEFLARLVGPAVRNADAEAELLAELAERDGVELAPWDWAFYTEQVRAERFDVDTAALRPYFDLERVLHDGVFATASRLYGIELVPRQTWSAITLTCESGRCSTRMARRSGSFSATTTRARANAAAPG